MQGRYDLNDASGLQDFNQRGSLVLAFVPSEFSALRGQITQAEIDGASFTEFFLQYNFTIGSHPAHRY